MTNLGIDECCEDKPLDEVCGGCRYGLMAYFLEHKSSIMNHTRNHDPKLWKEVMTSTFEL